MGGKTFLLIIFVIILTVAVAGGVSYFVMTKASDNTVSKPANGVMFKLGDPKEGLIINVGNNNLHYAKMYVVLELNPSKFKATEGRELNPEAVKISDAAIRALKSRTLQDYDPSKQDDLRKIVRDEANQILGDNIIMNVYFTGLVVQ